ncbi:hypothetical protein FRC14_005155 [Serendipita sp. 396]|nr:hypothetical protein FRC14_005155 [Serendipita sp. 396]KAG8781021.1 hypothetical protein FRC15_009096 [Serendipita sp. 397]KAG8799414.1 hypothetical protein FRC16_005188 [Serendipita sp. 398]KAG8822440.1 hypothetical protein FRC19_005963 [Serendipita sp. 401]KAG8826829.1 hypothetical protein FRC18_009979 [Serendipita sp. 400]KAG8867885.1 hypothetical protein FRC20_004600 [Serendipita sp. 405]KAG9055336.1 hypothetical protein FS842_002485 [Serendipita sp. 407]
MDHVLVEMDDDFGGNVDLGRGLAAASGIGVPIEARLRSLAIGILYEACRVQKFDSQELQMFNNNFIESLFDLVELTRNVDDESLNYSVIKLIVALNEQFMVASSSQTTDPTSGRRKKERTGSNRIIDVLTRRVNSSKTFGENIIFMLNRANDTEEDLVMQLLLLKTLYLLFTTPGTQRYFYTNDLRVLVDVFLRELVDLPEESEALRHTYLRVLNPLLTNTQLREAPYKTHLVRRTLEGLISPTNMQEVTPTTRRLVERCLGAEWCRDLPPDTGMAFPPTGTKPNIPPHLQAMGLSPLASLHSHSATHLPSDSRPEDDMLEPPQPAFKFKTLHKSMSAEVLPPTGPGQISKVDSINKGGQSVLKSSSAIQSSAPTANGPQHNSKDRNLTASRKSFVSSSGDDVEASMEIYRTHVPAHSIPDSKNSVNNARRPSLGNADLPRPRKPPPPVPTLDRNSLDSRRPFHKPKDIPPLIHRREPPAIPSKSKKPKSNGAISDSPLSKLAFSATTVAR